MHLYLLLKALHMYSSFSQDTTEQVKTAVVFNYLFLFPQNIQNYGSGYTENSLWSVIYFSSAVINTCNLF